MSQLPRITEVEHLGAHRLRLTFTDGLVRELDFDGALSGAVFAELADEAFFARVGVDAQTGTICWPNGVDLDPDVLHGDFEPATGRGPAVLREYRLRPTA